MASSEPITEGMLIWLLDRMPSDCRARLRCETYGTISIVPDARRVEAFARLKLGRSVTPKMVQYLVDCYRDQLDHEHFLRTGRVQ